MIVIQAATRGSVVLLQATSPTTEARVLHTIRPRSLPGCTPVSSRLAHFRTLSAHRPLRQSIIPAHPRRYNVCASTTPSPTVSHQQLHSRSNPTAILGRYQVANMSTRRSARLSAASALQASTAAKVPAPPQPAKRGRKRKADAEPSEHAVVDEWDVPEAAEEAAAPTTPAKRRTQKKSAAAPPATPTPSRAKLIAEPALGASAEAATTPKPKPAAVSRLADPYATHALLLSPETSRVVRAGRVGADTTTSLLEEANRHLVSVDERMRPLVERNHCRVFSPEGLAEKIDPFESLCSGIISQQVSGAAARSIKKRFVELFRSSDGAAAGEEEEEEEGGSEKEGREEKATGAGAGAPFPHPSQVAACAIEHLRTAGLSQRKAEYVRGLAEKFTSGELSAQLLADAPYEEVVERLIAVRGLGQWSVEMFACFGLKRMDVFSLGDLGVQRGMAAFEGRDVARLKAKGGGKFKYMSEKEMAEIAARFAPYRSLFMWYMWRVEETDISTLE